MKNSTPFGLILIGFTFFIGIFAAWVTHIIVAVQAKAWLFLIAGAIMPPIGAVHGIATWLGYDWLS